MNEATMFEAQTVARDTLSLPSFMPVPGFGVLPVNAFLIRAAQPVLVDTGLAALRQPFMERLRASIDPAELRWIWLTHTDPDHLGNLAQVLAEAPNARVVTNYLGMGKMGLYQLPLDRVYLLNPGQTLDVGDRQLMAVRPPCFDAPETAGLFDTKTRAFFSSDCFGALMGAPVDNARELDPKELRDGLVMWSTVDAPWLHMVSEREYGELLNAVRRLEPGVVLSNHLPAAADMTETLLSHLAEARSAPPFFGPDQAALERMMQAVA
jgi:hypothetical protein